MLKVSIIIPSYNHEKYVAQSIQSVLDQTFQDFEIVITDDGSTDGSIEVINRFKDPRIRLFCFEQNKGTCVALNHCINESRGEYIALLHSDDQFLPDKLKKQIEILDNNPAVGAGFTYVQLIDEEGKKFTDVSHPYYSIFRQPNRTRFEWLNHFFYEANALCHPTAMIRKQCFEKVGYYDERLAQMADFDLWIRICQHYEIHVIPEGLVNYRIRAGELNASGSRTDVRARLATEHAYILKNYLKIKTSEELVNIFPEAGRYWSDTDDRLIPFYVAMLALKKGWVMHHNFAISTLSEVLNNQALRKILSEKHGFSTSDFIRLTGRCDLFNINLIKEKEEENLQKEKELSRLRDQVQVQQNELNRIHAGIGWKLLNKLSRTINHFLPARTQRRQIYNKIIKYIKTVNDQTWSQWVTKFKIEIVHRNLADDTTYKRWILKNEPNVGQLKAMRCEAQSWAYKPKISIITPVYNPSEYDLTECINSVLSQVYDNWELYIVDGGSDREHVRKIIQRFSSKDKRIKVAMLPHNLGIAGNSNEALKLAAGEYVGFLDHDDMLAPFALYEVVKLLNQDPTIDFVYSDEDKVVASGTKRYLPFFKPEWSLDTFLSYNYLCHFAVARRKIVKEIGGLRIGFDGSQDYDLILRIIQKTNKIRRIPKILYHWRASETSASFDMRLKSYAIPAAKKALADYLKNQGLEAEVLDGFALGAYRVKYRVRPSQKISIIIPTKDLYLLLTKCVSSILEKTDYKDYEIVIVDNQSREPETYDFFRKIKQDPRIEVIHYDKPFNFSAINNFAVRSIDSEYLLFLNNDTEVINSEWLTAMLEFAQKNDVGAVGAKLYYPNNTVQHAGTILGVGGVANHAHLHFPSSSQGYMGRLKIVQNVSAVTGACTMLRKKVFDEVGGFEESLSHAFNDVDLCLKIREKGYLIVFTPYAELYHHESASRGYDLATPERKTRFDKEIEFMLSKWKHVLETGDPYYNPNLSLDKPDFSIKI